MFRPGSTVDLSSPGQLRLSRITGADSGRYECRVTSPLGHDAAQFVLNVEGEATERASGRWGSVTRFLADWSELYVGSG